MKNFKSTIRLSLITLRTEKFFIFYSIVSIILRVIRLLFPIASVKIIVSTYEETTDKSNFEKIVLVCIFLALGFYLLNIINFYLNKLMRRAQRNFKAKYEVLIYNKISVIDYETYQSSSFLNDYTKAIDEGSWLCINSWRNLVDFLSNIITVATIFTIFILLSYWIIVYAIVIGVISFFISKYNSKLYWELSELQKQRYRERGYVKRMFYLKDTTEDIKTSNVRNLLFSLNDEVGDQIIKNTDKFLSKRALLGFSSEFFGSTIYSFALIFVSLASLNITSYGNFTALIVAAGSLSSYVLNLSSALSDIQTDAAQGDTVFRVLDKYGKIETSGKHDAGELDELEINHLYFSYGDKEVLKDINLKIKKGEKIAIVGENGAGKTTFVKLLLRLYDPQNGAVLYNGIDYRDLYPMSIRGKIGAVFQEFEAYAFSVAENVLLRKVINNHDEELVIEALKFSGLYSKIENLSEGINTMVTKEFDENGVIFSGGERQKLAIARAYAANYDLLILDEPSSALDPLAEAEMYEKMINLGKDKTLIFISHRLSTTVKADKIYLFDNGKIVESGTHEELMKNENSKYKYMFDVQAKNYVSGSVEL